MAKQDAPKGLEARGRSLWAAISAKYDLRADELAVLEDACRESDLIDVLEAALAETGPTTKGSTGQMVVNPLVAELRQHRLAKKSLLAALKLPDDDTSDSAGRVSAQARAAANARWSRRGA